MGDKSCFFESYGQILQSVWNTKQGLNSFLAWNLQSSPCASAPHAVRADVKSAPHAVRADGKSAVLLSQTTSKAGSWGGAPPRKHGSLCAHAGGGESRIGDAFLPDKMIKC